MKRKLALAAIVIFLAGVHLYALLFAFGYLPVFILRPGLLRAARDFGGLYFLRATIVLTDIVVHFLVAVPFAFLLAAIFPKRWLPLAVVISCVPLLDHMVGFWGVGNEVPMSAWNWVYASLNALLLLGTLPAVTCPIRRYLQNDSPEPAWPKTSQ